MFKKDDRYVIYLFILYLWVVWVKCVFECVKSKKVYREIEEEKSVIGMVRG